MFVSVMIGHGLILRIFFALFILVINAMPGHAQPAHIIFDHYGPEDGLKTRTTRSVVKTNDGFVWLTTDDGLVRFDSERFLFFKHHQDDSTSIGDNACDQMVIDRHEMIWVVNGPGLDRFDPRTGLFTHCYFKQGTSKVYAFNPESLYYDDQRNRIWVGTSFGLFYVTIGSTELKRAHGTQGESQGENTTFYSIVQDKNRDLWLGSKKGFVRYQPAQGIYTAHSISKSEHDKDDAGVISLYVDEQNVLWIGTWVKGLIRYDIETGKKEQYFYADPNEVANGIVFITETSLAQHEDILWLSTVNLGFTAFHKVSKQFKSYRTVMEKDKQGIIGQTNRMLSTRSEGLWIASENGLHRYDFEDQVFGDIDFKRFNPALRNSFPTEYLAFERSTTGRDSVCWFHVPYVGAYQYNFYHDSIYDPPTILAPYFKGAVFGLFIDLSNRLWISSGPYGLVGYDVDRKEMIELPENVFDQDWKWISHFYEDARHRLWLGTYDGLFMLDSLRQNLEEISPLNSQLTKLKLSKHIRGLSEDHNGGLWFSASNDKSEKYAFGRLDVNTKQAEIFSYKSKGVVGLKDRTGMYDVVCMDQHVYIGTDHGLMTFSGNARPVQVRFMSQADGLINDFIPYLAPSLDKKLWCSTVFGVSSYSLDKNNFMNYTSSSSGLRRTKHPAVYASPNTGRIYVCQQGGLNVALSESTFLGDKVPEVIFTSLKISNNEYKQAGYHYEKKSSIPLKHHQNAITVEFVIPSYRNAEANRYSYRLVGIDESWVMTEQPFVSFASLAPGRYTLEVKGSTSEGVWTLEPSVMAFEIAPPFYQTWWFRLSIAAIVFTIVFYIVWLRFRALREQFALRTRLASDLHDEIGSTLTSIHILSKVSQQVLSSSPDQAREMLERITSQSKAVQQSMSDIVWAIRPDNDKIENLVIRLREYAVQTLEPLNIRTQINMEEDLIHQTMSLAARKELLLIFKEALHNIVKHAGATLVQVDLQKVGSVMKLIIMDNGIWKDDSLSTGTGKHSMQQRAQLLGGNVTWSIEPDGTKLSLVFRLAETSP